MSRREARQLRRSRHAWRRLQRCLRDQQPSRLRLGRESQHTGRRRRPCVLLDRAWADGRSRHRRWGATATLRTSTITVRAPVAARTRSGSGGPRYWHVSGDGWTIQTLGTVTGACSASANGISNGTAGSPPPLPLRSADPRAASAHSGTAGAPSSAGSVGQPAVKRLLRNPRASAVLVSNRLPTGTVFLSASTTHGTVTTPAVGSNGLVSAALGVLAAGATAKVSVVVERVAGGDRH